MSQDLIRGHLDGLVLAVLRGGPTHGYGLIEALRDRSGGFFDLPEGSVYPALHRLERAGQVASGWSEVGGRRRRVYALTTAGRRAAEQRQNDWRSFSAAVERVFGAGGPTERTVAS
ncbi:helix-turn-helix transcriptional regulator [Catenulispora yoronensis]|uniref:Helix-turn-helix transcriptional regulator n=1 Tax=Catenulispora yoronensis TaxID=450799 RepID=A0ABP5F287_9ACTN